MGTGDIKPRRVDLEHTEKGVRWGRDINVHGHLRQDYTNDTRWESKCMSFNSTH